MQRLIELRKLKGSARKPRYATRKLSIGLVSCMLGFTLIVSGTEAKAAEATDTIAVDEETTDEKDPADEVSNDEVDAPTVDEKDLEAKEEEAKEETKKSLAEINNPSAISDRKYKSGDAASDYVSGLNSEDVSSISWSSSTPSEGDSSASINVTYTDGSVDTVLVGFSVDPEEPTEEGKQS